jgi:transposase InsO family protein
MAHKSFEIDQFLSGIYYTIGQPGSYSGVRKLWNEVKKRQIKPKGITLSVVGKWLKEQTTHNIHSTPTKIFNTEHIIVEHIDDQWDSDIIQMDELAKYNRGYKYILICIDLFSRYAWARPLKFKKSTDVTIAFTDIVKTSGRECKTIRTDQGGEYTGASFQRLVHSRGINHMIAYGRHKASYSERFNRTLENKLFKYFYEQQTAMYIDILDDVMFSYNNTVHHSINMAPAAVNTANSHTIYEQVYIPILNRWANTPVKFTIALGSLVRLSLYTAPFSRGYHEKWTEELFTVCNQIPSHPPRYKVQDLNGDSIKGSFYTEELLVASVQNINDITYKIDRVLKTKTVRGHKLSLVKWYGYSDKFNTYIPTASIRHYKGKI